MVVGSERLVVVNVIHASVQLASSSFSVNVGLYPFGGGSVVSQVVKFNIKLRRIKRSSVFIFIFLPTIKIKYGDA